MVTGMAARCRSVWPYREAVNRLAEETSPYLSQHADNPVDWYPWGDEAFAEAARRDVPLLLSVGYSACHWCHVMAHESFEDPETAAVMNELFVNVKVDREQRPDVDAVYMEATQALTGQGGWPMTVFCTPSGEPFFCGTYFPKQTVHGRPGFVDLCRSIDRAWCEKRDDVVAQAAQVTEHLATTSLTADADRPVPTAATLDLAVDELVKRHDREWGGFGGAPKFPQTMSLELLLRTQDGGGSNHSLDAVLTSLDAMASGGIYDHLGGGFARYSVDRQWLVPHFEKMLYDQALLARVYLHAWQVTDHDRFRQVVEETVGYVLRDLRDPADGFWSAEDADSEGVEGRFYVWTANQLTGVLGEAATEAATYWGVTEHGNFEGVNILNRLHARGDLLRPAPIEQSRRRLFEFREQRVRPALDDKVLTEWNALMVATLAEAAATTGRQDWLDQATTAADFLLHRLRSDDGRWLRTWQDDGTAGGRASVPAFATDHAALVDAFTRLAEATGQARWIAEARNTADALIELFWDGDDAGFFTTGHDVPALVARQKDLLDGATPSANSLATVALLRLSALTGHHAYRRYAEQVLSLLAPVLDRQPSAFAHLLGAVDLDTAGITEIVIPGPATELVTAVQRRYLPRAVLAWGEPYGSPLWEGRETGKAYVCRDYACQVPATDPTQLMAQLDR